MKSLKKIFFNKLNNETKVTKTRMIASILLLIFVGFTVTKAWSAEITEVPLSLFPLHRYDQNVDTWLNPKDPNYTKPLVSLDYQKKRLQEYYNHYFSTAEDAFSPWSKNHVTKIMQGEIKLADYEKKLLEDFSNHNKEIASNQIGFGENFRPYEQDWIDKIAANIDFEKLEKSTQYRPEMRAILVQNSMARSLPTIDPHFYNFKLPGQGYPFDNLQISAIWAGTPLYVIAQSKDKSWSFVIAPEFKAWVQTKDLAMVSHQFIKRWQNAVKKNLLAITETETIITDSLTQKFQLKAYVGSIFPLVEEKGSLLKIFIPVKDMNGRAQMRQASIKREHGAKMPLSATPQNFAKLLKTLQKRPYGWGGYNFYNDCSMELKSIYAPFGIWLPRNSLQQASAGKKIDLENNTLDERLNYLKKEGRSLMTIVYIKGHVFMYLGKFSNTHLAQGQGLGDDTILMTYQNLWALKPEDESHRSVVGQAVFMPLLKTFSEDKDIHSQAGKQHFQIIFLDEWPEEEIPAETI